MTWFSLSIVALHTLLLAVTSSHGQIPDTCEEVNSTVFQHVCPNVSSVIRYTRFPNVHSHSQASDADSELAAFAWVTGGGTSCSIDLELFVCLYHFPTCRETTGNVAVVQPPCRDFCNRILDACANDFLSNGITFTSAHCSVLPPFDPVNPTFCYDRYYLIVINEVSTQSFAAPTTNYVELWDFGMKDTLLDSFFIVFFQLDGTFVRAIDLNDRTTQGGYFTIGNSHSNIEFVQVSGTEAVALYRTNK